MTFSRSDAEDHATARMDALMPRIVENWRAVAQLMAEQAELLHTAHSIAEDWRTGEGSPTAAESEFPHRSIAAEIATALRISDRTVQRRLGASSVLVTQFSATHAALAAGEISSAHVHAIVEGAAPIASESGRHAYEEHVLRVARAESATRVKAVARRVAEQFADEPLASRHERARAARGVWVTDLDDGMSQLCAVLPSVLAHGIDNRLGAIAHQVEDAARDAGDDDPRTIPHVKADILADLLLASAPAAHTGPLTGLAGIHADVQLTVFTDTIDGTGRPGFLDGMLPIDADTACTLAGAAPAWNIVTRHPLTHDVISVDRYRPSEAQRRHLRARDAHCRFPGCRIAARRCDIDHTIDHALGGDTTTENLAHLCRRHHTLKHQTAWTVQQRSGGILDWTSPTGRVYTDHPPGTIAFTPAA